MYLRLGKFFEFGCTWTGREVLRSHWICQHFLCHVHLQVFLTQKLVRGVLENLGTMKKNPSSWVFFFRFRKYYHLSWWYNKQNTYWNKRTAFLFCLFSQIWYSLFAGSRNYLKLNKTTIHDVSTRQEIVFWSHVNFCGFGRLWLPGVGEEVRFHPPLQEGCEAEGVLMGPVKVFIFLRFRFSFDLLMFTLQQGITSIKTKLIFSLQKTPK